MSSAAHTLVEQQNLLGGTDLVETGRRRKRGGAVRVAQPRLGFARALALVVAYGRQEARERGTTALSRCPRCGHVGPTEQDFGLRVIRGERRPQSWCRACRGQHLPSLSALPTASATVPEVAQAQSSTGVRSAGATSHTAEGWLFPPESLERKRS